MLADLESGFQNPGGDRRNVDTIAAQIDDTEAQLCRRCLVSMLNREQYVNREESTVHVGLDTGCITVAQILCPEVNLHAFNRPLDTCSLGIACLISCEVLRILPADVGEVFSGHTNMSALSVLEAVGTTRTMDADGLSVVTIGGDHDEPASQDISSSQLEAMPLLTDRKPRVGEMIDTLIALLQPRSGRFLSYRCLQL